MLIPCTTSDDLVFQLWILAKGTQDRLDEVLGELRQQLSIRIHDNKGGVPHLLPSDVNKVLTSGRLCNGQALLNAQYMKRIAEHPKDCRRCGTTASKRLGWN